METACLGCKFDAGTGRLARSGLRLPGNGTRTGCTYSRPPVRTSRTIKSRMMAPMVE